MEEKRKFKVGDRVIGVGIVDSECIKGLTGTIVELRRGLYDYGVMFDVFKDGFHSCNGRCKHGYGYYVKEPSIKPLNETIVIYRKDNEVIALDKSTGKKAVAKCSPADEFNFNTGAKLALERLTRNVTFRILCLDNKLTFFNRGDIYEFVDGQATWRDGTKSSHYKNFNGFISYNPLWRNKVIELKEGDDPAEILKKYDETIKVGDTVKVINSGACYNTYSDFFVDNSLGVDVASRYIYGESINSRADDKFKVLFIGKHTVTHRKIAVIEDKNLYRCVYLIGIEGLKKC